MAEQPFQNGPGPRDRLDYESTLRPAASAPPQARRAADFLDAESTLRRPAAGPPGRGPTQDAGAPADREAPPDNAAAGEVRLDQRLGKYLITNRIGEGAMGVVFKATDTTTRREYAIKVLSPALAADPQALEDLKKEFVIADSVVHENLLKVNALETAGGVAYLVMEYVDGETLEEYRCRRKFTAEDFRRIAPQILAGLARLHDRGLLHLDIKPHNILISRAGDVKLADYGVAQTIRDQARRGADGRAAAGTLCYMAPEQLRGGAPLDRRADVYATGMLFHRLLSDRFPFDERDREAIARWHLDPKHRVAKLEPARVAPVLAKALAVEPDRRYAGVADLREDLIRAGLIDRAAGEAAPSRPAVAPATGRREAAPLQAPLAHAARALRGPGLKSALLLAGLTTAAALGVFLLAFGLRSAIGWFVWGAAGWVIRTAAITLLFAGAGLAVEWGTRPAEPEVTEAEKEARREPAKPGGPPPLPDRKAADPAAAVAARAAVWAGIGLLFAVVLGWRVVGIGSGTVFGLGLGAAAGAVMLLRRGANPPAIAGGGLAFGVLALLLFGVGPFHDSGAADGVAPASDGDAATTAALVGRWSKGASDHDVSLEFTRGGSVIHHEGAGSEEVASFSASRGALAVSAASGYGSNKTETRTYPLDLSSGDLILGKPGGDYVSGFNYLEGRWVRGATAAAPPAKAPAAPEVGDPAPAPGAPAPAPAGRARKPAPGGTDAGTGGGLHWH